MDAQFRYYQGTYTEVVEKGYLAREIFKTDRGWTCDFDSLIGYHKTAQACIIAVHDSDRRYWLSKVDY